MGTIFEGKLDQTMLSRIFVTRRICRELVECLFPRRVVTGSFEHARCTSYTEWANSSMSRSRRLRFFEDPDMSIVDTAFITDRRAMLMKLNKVDQ